MQEKAGSKECSGILNESFITGYAEVAKIRFADEMVQINSELAKNNMLHPDDRLEASLSYGESVHPFRLVWYGLRKGWHETAILDILGRIGKKEIGAKIFSQIDEDIELAFGIDWTDEQKRTKVYLYSLERYGLGWREDLARRVSSIIGLDTVPDSSFLFLCIDFEQGKDVLKAYYRSKRVPPKIEGMDLDDDAIECIRYEKDRAPVRSFHHHISSIDIEKAIPRGILQECARFLVRAGKLPNYLSYGGNKRTIYHISEGRRKWRND